MKDLDVRWESIKILEENIASNLVDICHSNFFQDMSPKARETKAKMNFWDLIELKSFCTAKETVLKTKMQPMEWEKIFANDITDKGLVSKIYKELLKLNTQSSQEMDRRHEQTLLQRRHTNGKQTHEDMLNITHHQTNTNQNHNEIPPHPY